MKLLIFSDIHGSAPVGELIADLAQRHLPDYVLLLGDILYHGPRNPLPQGYAPKETARLLEPLASRIIAVQGNCDSEVDAMVLPFPLAPELSWILASLPERSLRLCLTHGHKYGPHNPPALSKGDVLLFGHTHIPLAEPTFEGIYLCNPGSLALPKEGHPPCFGLFENGIFSVFTNKGELYRRLSCA